MSDKQTTLEPAARGRRPIPLPPSSLRPPPRTRKPTSSHPEPPVPVPEAEPGALGSRRGFWVGLALPVVGLGIAAVLWWVGEGGLDHRSAAGPAPGTMEVRSRMAGVPATGGPAAPGAEESAAAGSRTPAPERAAETAPAARTASPPAPTVTVQVGSYRTRAKAERVLAQVTGRTGLPGVILDSRVDGVAWHRILLGAFATPAAAREAVRPLEAEHEVMVRPLPDRWAPVLTGARDGNAEGGAS